MTDRARTAPKPNRHALWDTLADAGWELVPIDRGYAGSHPDARASIAVEFAITPGVVVMSGSHPGTERWSVSFGEDVPNAVVAGALAGAVRFIPVTPRPVT
jgi:hypothetical protein